MRGRSSSRPHLHGVAWHNWKNARSDRNLTRPRDCGASKLSSANIGCIFSRRGMTSLAATEPALAKRVRVSADTLSVELADGRVVSVPVGWYPRLAAGTLRERRRWELIGPGIGIHWPALDEDISVEALLKGLRSGESANSLERWLASRRPANTCSRRAALGRKRNRRTVPARLAAERQALGPGMADSLVS